MCDYSGKIVAWLDRELDGGEMADVERHLGQCVECRTQLRAYEQVSKTFDVYRDEVMAASMHRKVARRMVVLSDAAVVAVAVAAALLVVFTYTHFKTLDLPSSVKADPPLASVLAVAPAPSSPVALPKAVHRRHVAPSPAQTQNVNWLPARPVIEIAIPADSMFPPGAVPEGVDFIADLSIAPDGSTQQIRLQPRLIGFERRVIQP
jgi:hypothetical protein